MNKIYGIGCDLNFKNILGKANPLKLFMKDIFDETIRGKITFLDKETKIQNKNLSFGVYDLLIETDDAFIIVEMQNKDLKNIEPRMTMYASRVYINHNHDHNNYQNVKPVKIFLILNYPYGKEDVIKEYQELETRSQEQFGNYSEIKIWNIRESLKNKNTIYYKYALLFTLSEHEANKSKHILSKLKEEERFKEITKMIERYNMDLHTYQKIEEEEKMEMTFEQAVGNIAYEAKEEGIKKGIRKGKREGIKMGKQQGKQQEKLEIMKKMLSKGLDIEIIADVTGLSKNKIMKNKQLLSL